MQTFRCSTEPDKRKRPQPKMESSVLMKGKWSFHAYKRSHDGKHNVIFNAEGYDLHLNGGRTSVRMKYTFHGSERGFYWSPDNKRIIYFGTGEKDAGDASRCIVMLDVSRVGKEHEGRKPPHKVAYAPPPGNVPFGLEWSPSGEAFYVVERLREENIMYSRIMRVPVNDPEGATQIARINGIIDFFMPPVSRFEDGEGVSNRQYWIVFGHRSGLYICRPKGGKYKRVSKLPAVGLHNIEWHPRKNKLLLYFRRAIRGADGTQFRGVYLVHLDKIGRSKKKKRKKVEAEKKKAGPPPLPEYLEHLYGETDIHTLWYSPNGKYMTWASSDAIYYRKSSDPASKTVKIVAIQDELELEVKGVTWHQSESKLAFTAANHVFVYDLKQPKPKPRRVATFGTDTTHFTAEPIWLGEDVYMTVFQDLTRNKRRNTDKSTPAFITPKNKKETDRALKAKARAEAKNKKSHKN